MMTELEQVIDRGDRGRKWFLIAIGLVCMGIVGGVAFAIVVNVNQGKQLSKIESPCLKYGPDSKQCEEAFSAAVSTITHPQACAIQRKAGTLQAVRELAEEIGVNFSEPCAGARIDPAQPAGEQEETNRPISSVGGGALQTGSTGHQQPAPLGGGDTGPGGGPSGSGGNPPSADPAPASQGGGNGTGTPPGSESGNGSPPPGPKAVPEQATDALEEVTGTVTDTVDEVTDDVGETVDETCEHLPPALCSK